MSVEESIIKNIEDFKVLVNLTFNFRKFQKNGIVIFIKLKTVVSEMSLRNISAEAIFNFSKLYSRLVLEYILKKLQAARTPKIKDELDYRDY